MPYDFQNDPLWQQLTNQKAQQQANIDTINGQIVDLQDQITAQQTIVDHLTKLITEIENGYPQ